MVRLHRMRLRVDDSSLLPVLDAIRRDNEIPADFPPEVDAQVDALRSEWERFLEAVTPADEGGALEGSAGPLLELPELAGAAQARRAPWKALVPDALPLLDATAIPFVTIDPPSSRDLDQALRLSRLPEGRADGAVYLVDYAIASLATFVRAGTPLDAEVRARGLTVYLPDESTPLHPSAMSEGFASLLPGENRAACAWRILLDESGAVVSATVRRALVRSRAKLSYDEVEAAHVEGAPLEGAPADLVELLAEIGEKRRALETLRGGVSAPTPEQEITREADPDGSTHYELSYRRFNPIEEWNAQISLLTGMCAAAIMRSAGVGILRTVPPAPPVAIERLRDVAQLLRVDWPEGLHYADLVPRLTAGDPATAAFLSQAMSLYRGASYTVVADPGILPEAGDEGGAGAGSGRARIPFPPPGDPSVLHAAIAAEYAHTTAPLRRLVDRWSLEICRAVCAREAIPEWVLSSLLEIPGCMEEGMRKAGAAEREAIGAVSARLLLGHEGESFHGVIVERKEANAEAESGKVLISDPAVTGSVRSAVPGARLPLGEETEVVLVEADPVSRRIRFTWEGPAL